MWLWTGFGLVFGFIGYFNTRLVNTLNYSAIPDLRTLLIARLAAISYPPPSLLVTNSFSSDRSTESESESYVTTGGQSASLSWNKAPIWGLRPDIYYCQTFAGLFMWGALSDEKTGLSFTIASGPRQRSHSRVRVPWDSRPYFSVSDSTLSYGNCERTK
jgi:hypothetical protein